MFLYLIHNNINEKVYVGQTIRTVKLRWEGHLWHAGAGAKTSIANSIRKYGKDAFTVQPVAECRTEKELDNLEKVWIILLQTRNKKFGYNLRSGGEGGTHSEESKRKLSIARKNRVTTDEARKNMSEAQKRRAPPSAETREKHRQRMLGKRIGAGPRSEETKQRMRKPKSSEHRAKIIAHLENVRRTDSKRNEKGQFTGEFV